MILGWLLLASLLQSANTGSIEGVVVRAGTSDPLNGVLVLASNVDATYQERASTPSMTTSVGGRFRFDKLLPGSYRLLLSANGYVRQEYGQRTFPGNGALVTLAAGQQIRDLVASITPTGTVTGRILDRNGRPLPAVPVQLVRYLYDENGLGILRPYGTAQTDDRGEYRIYFVTPGRYYLTAGSAQGPGGYGGPRLGPNEAAMSYSAAYYPGVRDVRSASVIDVRPGTIWSGIDMTLARQTLYRVSGRVIDSVTGQPPEAPAMWLFHFDPAIARPAAISGTANSGKFFYDRGRFEFRGVVPGPYTLAASEKNNSAENSRAMRFGFVQLEVANSDVDGVVLSIPPGAAVAGRISLEGENSPNRAFLDGGVRYVSLVRTANGLPLTMPRDWEAGTRLGPDGSFQLRGITAGEYRVEVSLLAPGFYIKEIRYGLADALNRPLRFNPADAASLEITLSSRVAQVSGSVMDDLSQPAAGAQVVLVPSPARDRPELFKTATTDQNGRFTIRNAAPGEYRLMAWEAIETYSWFDPEVLKRSEPFSTPIQLSESASATANLRLIPAR